MVRINLMWLSAAMVASSFVGATSAVLLLQNPAFAQPSSTVTIIPPAPPASAVALETASVETLPPDLRSGALRPVDWGTNVPTRYAIQGHFGDWIRVTRINPPGDIWINLATRHAWERTP